MSCFMPCLKIVKNESQIPVRSGWSEVTNFKNKDKVVDVRGKPVVAGYSGRQYQLISKQERFITFQERVGRICLGTLAVICSMFFALGSKSVRNLFVKHSQTIRYAVLVSPSSPLKNKSQKPSACNKPAGESSQAKGTPELQNPKDNEQEELFVSNKAIGKINTSMRAILQGKNTDGIKQYSRQGNHRVFELKSVPGMIFKMKVNDYIQQQWGDGSINACYEKMKQARTVVQAHKLDLLVIPRAKLFSVQFEGKNYDIIAEEKLDINPKSSVQEGYFSKYADSLKKAILQLATFICKTKCIDVEWRTIPVLNNSLDSHGNRKIGLVHIKEMFGDARIGLFGGAGRRGLVGCVTEEHGKLIEALAKKNGVNTTSPGISHSFETAHNERIAELEDDKMLKKYHEKKHIVQGNEPISLDVDSLDFSAFPRQAKELKKITHTLIQTINEKIAKSSQNDTLKGRRNVIIGTDLGPFHDPNYKCIYSSRPYDKKKNPHLLECVFKKLIEVGAIYKTTFIFHGYCIQA